MDDPRRPFFTRPLTIGALSFAAILVVEFGLWRLSVGSYAGAPRFWLFWLAAFGAAGGISVALVAWLRNREGYRQALEQVEREKSQYLSLDRRLNGMIRLNQSLIDAQTEKELVENALSIIADISSAIGCSFMPFDEWGQPLNPYTHGGFPAPVMQAWAEHLSNSSVRNRCRVCQKLEAKSGEICPLLETPFSDSVRIYCLPLNREGRLVGMLNVYLPIESALTDDLYGFLVVLLREMVLAVETIRLRGKEITTLRQIQMLDDQDETLQTTVRRLLEGLSEALDFDAARIDFKPALPQFPGFRTIYGDQPWLNSTEADQVILDVLEFDCPNPGARVIDRLASNGLQTVVTPCCLPEGGVIGGLILVAEQPFGLHARHISLIETVATQAAVLVENVRRQLDREYRVVIQERVRLAREIHDSLAQTLAYLKLTAAQMQNQLASGDLNHLQQSLSQSYQALSDAYLETRQAIDNLRLTPLDKIGDWMDQLVRDFKITSGLSAICAVPPDLPEVSPEIQAQLLRIVQEALSNIRKHAQASQVRVNLRVWNGDLVLEISDDGIGFSSEDVPELSRHGLRGMRERAELIGADFQIISQPQQGTSIRLQIPLNIEETPV